MSSTNVIPFFTLDYNSSQNRSPIPPKTKILCNQPIPTGEIIIGRKGTGINSPDHSPGKLINAKCKEILNQGWLACEMNNSDWKGVKMKIPDQYIGVADEMEYDAIDMVIQEYMKCGYDTMNFSLKNAPSPPVDQQCLNLCLRKRCVRVSAMLPRDLYYVHPLQHTLPVEDVVKYEIGMNGNFQLNGPDMEALYNTAGV